jgi:hypothetical protein
LKELKKIVFEKEIERVEKIGFEKEIQVLQKVPSSQGARITCTELLNDADTATRFGENSQFGQFLSEILPKNDYLHYLFVHFQLMVKFKIK